LSIQEGANVIVAVRWGRNHQSSRITTYRNKGKAGDYKIWIRKWFRHPT
jgi:hypothetical protein